LTLKSGCRIEALGWKSGQFGKAIVMYTSVAARIVALRDGGTGAGRPATVLLSADECAVLVAKFGQRHAGLRLTLGQAVLWIGRLGGHSIVRGRDAWRTDLVAWPT